MNVAAVFAIIELVGVGLEYAERIGAAMGANEEELKQIAEMVDRRRKAALDRMNDTE